MLMPDTIKTFANKLQTTEVNIRREYVQHLFLSYFYQQPISGNIFFKGDTALRMIYNSPSFSENLDFNGPAHHIQDIEAGILETVQEIEREGIAVEEDKIMLERVYTMLQKTQINFEHELQQFLPKSQRKKG